LRVLGDLDGDMTALIDGRPPGLDAYYRPGKTFTYDMPWTAGYLAGRTFTATLNAAALAVAVDGDTMTVTATAAQTTAAGLGAQAFTLTETTGGASEPVIVGTWAGSDRAATSATSDTITVAASAATVTVNVAASDARYRRPHITVPSGWGTRWRAALTEADTRLVRVGVLGDSLTNGPYTDNFDGTYIARTQAALQAEYGDGGSGWLDYLSSAVGGFGGPGGPGGNDALTSGAWTNVNGGVNGYARQPTVAGNGATITLFPRGSTLDLVTRTDPTFGRYDYTVDGGAPVQVPQNAGAAVSTLTLTPGGAGYHPVVFTAAAGQCRIHGARGRNATGVMFDRFAQGGRAIAGTSGATLDTAAEGLAGQTTLSTTFDVMTGLDLVILVLGVNDSQSASGSTSDLRWNVLNNLQREIRTAGINVATPPEVLVIIEHVSGHGDATSPYRFARIAAELHEWARAIGAAVVDLWAFGRYSAEYGNSLGWWGLTATDVHPSTAGYTAMAAPIIDVLTH
jgi:lysophospholipase L1-like esterase